MPVCGCRDAHVGLVWPSLRPKSGSKSNISGWILKSFRVPFSSAELRAAVESGWGLSISRFMQAVRGGPPGAPKRNAEVVLGCFQICFGYLCSGMYT